MKRISIQFKLWSVSLFELHYLIMEEKCIGK